MKKITKKDYELETYNFDKRITRAFDKKNNAIHLCATYARYFMCIVSSTRDKFFELTPEEFTAKERELMGDTIYRISELEFKDKQGFRYKLAAFKIYFYDEEHENHWCNFYFYFNENGVFARGSDIFDELTGYFKISDNLNQFPIEKILKRLKKHYPKHNFKYTINFL